MFALNLPIADIKINQSEGKTVIYDFLRRRYVALTPEEWVRQQFIRFLTDSKGYPAALMGNEMELCANGKKRRCDSVVFNTQGKPLVIIEYKAPTISITRKVFEQLSSYNIILRTKYLFATNGISHYCCRVDYEAKSFRFLREIPNYQELEQ